jgi:citrate synthase
VWYLLFEGELPTIAARDSFARRIAAARHLPPEVAALLPALAAGHPHPLAALRTALSQLAAVEGMPPTYDADPETIRTNAIRLSAATPVLIAGLHRASLGLAPIAPRDDLGHAANYLWMIDGEVPDPRRARAVEQYLILGIDHGFNASTFTARVVTSTGADVGAAVVAAMGALSGPLHGGAPSRALDTLDAIGTPERTEQWVRDAVGAGDRIMGFGHAVYKTADPRSVMLRGIAQSLGGDRVDFAVQVEDTVQRVLAELKPGRDLYTNVEYYAGVVMEQCGIPRELFTSTFAASRVVGWCAHVLEQSTETAIIRPSARYVGPEPPAPVPTAS